MVELGFAQDKSAFGKTVGNIYTPGVKVLKVSGGYLKTKINGFIGLEYYFTYLMNMAKLYQDSVILV